MKTTRTGATGEAMSGGNNPAYREFLDLEDMISVAQSHANALNILLAHTLVARKYQPSQDEREAVCHLAGETMDAIAKLWREWNDGHDRLHGRVAS